MPELQPACVVAKVEGAEGLQASISSSLRTLAEAAKAPELSTNASPVRARVLHATSMPMCIVIDDRKRPVTGAKRP